jgi:hypothetical protein
MGQSIDGVHKLLEVLSGLLKDDGQILTNARIIDVEYFEANLAPVYAGEQGSFFNWISFNEPCFRRVCEDAGLHANVLMREKNTALYRITKR